MTDKHEQLRQLFLEQVGHLITDGTIETRDLTRAGISFRCGNLHAAFLAWQAARRAPVVPVWYVPITASIGTVQRAMEDGWNKCVDAMLAAEPRPPEADSNSHEFDGIKPEAAPVQLPESMGVLRVFEPHENSGVVCTEASVNAGHLSHGWHLLYTDQQVRQLLADQGIKVIE